MGQEKNNIALLVAWNLSKYNNKYYTLNTHYVYLEYISKKYNKVYLVSSVSNDILTNSNAIKENKCINKLTNINVIELPQTKSYLSSQKQIFKYYKTIKRVAKDIDLFYTRVPDPFCWMPKLLFRKKTIMHFVGDTIDATKYNEKWSWLKKRIMICGYLPDYLLTLWAGRGSKVYTNGYHLADRLSKYGIKATPVISSTIREKDLDNNVLSITKKQTNKITLVYLGYVRFAKGMNLLMNLWLQLKKQNIDFHFNMIGEGEMYEEVKQFIKQHHLENNITLYGHIGDRKQINDILQNSDIFVFPSLSEGSPRVVVEAMAQGIPVMSTPVGSLPTTFTNKESIRFFDFNNTEQALDIIKDYVNDKQLFEQQRKKAFNMVKENYTIERFLEKVFSYEA